VNRQDRRAGPGGSTRARRGTQRARPKLRPTSALVRGALFNRLGSRVPGGKVLDLFAGTGSLGLEALRREAAEVIFVEHDARLVAAIRARLATEDLAERAEVWQRDAGVAVGELGSTRRRFDLIFMDPPYGGGWIPRMLHRIAETGTLAEGGIVVAEGHWRDRPDPAPGWNCTREARYGETVLWYFACE